MIQNALMWAMLSSISRAIARVLRSVNPVGPGSAKLAVFGNEGQRNHAVERCALLPASDSACNLPQLDQMPMRSAGVSTWP